MYAKLSKKGQVTIPKRIREYLGVSECGNILFVLEEGDVKVKGVPSSDPEKLAGSLKPYAEKYVDLRSVREEVGLRVAEETAEKGFVKQEMKK